MDPDATPIEPPPTHSDVEWPAAANINYSYDGCWLMQNADGAAPENSPMHQLHNGKKPDAGGAEEVNTPPVFDYQVTPPLRAPIESIPCVQTKR